MSYSKRIKITEDGPKIHSNGNSIFNDSSLSLKDYNPQIKNWTNSTVVLNKGESIDLKGDWSFIFVRLRWLDRPVNNSNDGVVSIYEACSSNSLVSNSCGCSSGVSLSTGKTVNVPSLATIELTQSTEYILSDEFAYLKTNETLLGPTEATANPKTEDLYDKSFNSVLLDGILYFPGATAGPTGSTANPYPEDKEYYSYLNQDKDVLFVYDIGIEEWVLLSTDTDFSSVNGNENISISYNDQYIWSSESNELGNSQIFTPGSIGPSGQDNNTFTITGNITLLDENQPSIFKFSEILSLSAFKFNGKLISDLDNQEINILLGF